MLDKFIPPLPEFDLSKKLFLVNAPPKETCTRKSCEIQGKELNRLVAIKNDVTTRVELEHFEARDENDAESLVKSSSRSENTSSEASWFQ